MINFQTHDIENTSNRSGGKLIAMIYQVPRASLVAQLVRNLPAVQETQVWSLGREDPLEKGVATHSDTLAWRIPWTEEPGGLQSMGSQRVGHNCATNFCFQFSSVHLLSHVWLFATPWIVAWTTSPTPGVHSNSRLSSPWCHLAISSSVLPFSSCPQSLPASESFSHEVAKILEFQL